MPGERLSMRKIREVLRLLFGNHLSQRSVQLTAGAVNGDPSPPRCAGIAGARRDDSTTIYCPATAVSVAAAAPMDQRPAPDRPAVDR